MNQEEKVIGQIYETYDYDKFSFIETNREVMPNKQLETSIKEEGIKVPIMVDEWFNIIEGQHRFTFAKKHVQPIRYFFRITSEIDEDKNVLNDITKLNTTQRRWRNLDYIYSYAKSGNEQYRKLYVLLQQYPKLNLTAVYSTATGKEYNAAAHSESLKDGKFVFHNYDSYVRFVKDYFDFLERTEIKHYQEVMIAYFSLYASMKFDNERCVQKFKESNVAESVEGIRKVNVLQKKFLVAYNKQLKESSPNFIDYRINRDESITITDKKRFDLIKDTKSKKKKRRN